MVVPDANKTRGEIEMTWLLLNIPLMIVFFALWTVVPLWMVLRGRDTGPKSALATVSQFPHKPDSSYEADYRRRAA
jgi:hypothetical protein